MSVTLSDGDLTLRLLRKSDYVDWVAARQRNANWLGPWNATLPPESIEQRPSYRQMVRMMRADARARRSFGFALVVEGTFRGQVTLGDLVYGPLSSGYIGYWIDQQVAGRGIMPRAVALTTDFAFFRLGVHRIEINIRPENVASLRVVEKLGFRYEGTRQRYLHIDGDWRDHYSFAITREEVPQGLLAKVKERSHLQ